MTESAPLAADARAEDLAAVHVDDHVELDATVAGVVAVTARTAGLTTLDLRVAGRPELATLVRGRAVSAGLAVWSVHLPPCRWHQGLVLVATAARRDTTRVAAVDGAAALLHDLLLAEGRRAQAERDAAHAHRATGVDPLTQLGNRRAWERALGLEAARAARYSGPSSVVVLDLDGLKSINDRLGHTEGDAYLRRASAAIGCAARTVDAVCRVGGDEFAVLAPETGKEGAHSLASRLAAELARVGVEASIGFATTEDGRLDEAWQAADVRMYADKRRRGARRSPSAD
jgi:diguanylate cyclase (GGDEF)-like protein